MPETHGDRNVNTADVCLHRTKGDLLGVVVYIFIPALGREKQVDLCEFKGNLVYIASPKP